MWMGQSNRSRRQIAADLSRIDMVDRGRERRDDRDRNGNGEDCQGYMRTPSVAPVEIVVHAQHLQRPDST